MFVKKVHQTQANLAFRPPGAEVTHRGSLPWVTSLGPPKRPTVYSLNRGALRRRRFAALEGSGRLLRTVLVSKRALGLSWELLRTALRASKSPPSLFFFSPFSRVCIRLLIYYFYFTCLLLGSYCCFLAFLTGLIVIVTKTTRIY